MGFRVKPGISKSQFLLAGLHGVESSRVSDSSLLGLPSACSSVVSLASEPTRVLSWSRNRQLRKFLVYRPEHVLSVIYMIHSVAEGCVGHAPLFVC